MTPSSPCISRVTESPTTRRAAGGVPADQRAVHRDDGAVDHFHDGEEYTEELTATPQKTRSK